MKDQNASYGIVLLAAGASRRMGKPKQGLVFKGKPLVRIAALAALETGGKLVVVTGAAKEEVEKALEGLNTELVFNADWATGMASSIRVGIKSLQSLPEKLNGAIILLCDQPYISSDHLIKLIREKEQNETLIVASSYNDVLGTPVLFDATLFEDLLLLTGDTGAKSILNKYSTNVISVPFPEGSYDLDTEKDYEALLKIEHDQGQI